MIYLGYYSAGFIQKSTITSWPVGQRVATSKFATHLNDERQPASRIAWHAWGTGDWGGTRKQQTQKEGRERIYWSGGASSKPAKAPCWLVPGCWAQTCTEDEELLCTETCRAAKPADTTPTGRKAGKQSRLQSPLRRVTAKECKCSVQRYHLQSTPYNQGIRTTINCMLKLI